MDSCFTVGFAVFPRLKQLFESLQNDLTQGHVLREGNFFLSLNLIVQFARACPIIFTFRFLLCESLGFPALV